MRLEEEIRRGEERDGGEGRCEEEGEKRCLL